MKVSIIWKVTIAIFVLASNYANAQFLNKLKDKANKLADERVDQIVEKAIDKTNNNTNQKHKNNSSSLPTSKNGDVTARNVKFDDRIIFEAPTDDFVNFELLSYKGLPRFGILPKVDDNAVRREQQRFYEIYSSLIELKHSKDKIDLEQLRRDNLGTHSPYRINGVKRLTYLATNEKAYRSYFCNNDVDCKIPQLKFLGDSDDNGVGNFHWGGKGASEFQQRRAFNSFLEKDYGVLAEWGSKMWKNDHEIAYLVKNLSLDSHVSYDFHRQGYRLDGGLRRMESENYRNGTFHQLQIVSRYIAHHPFEKDAAESQKTQVFFQIKQEEAEKLAKANINEVFAVYKIKMSFLEDKEIKIKGYRYPHKLIFKHHLESPVVEVFADAELTNKIGEFSLEKSF
jgi:hypothetical protein